MRSKAVPFASCSPEAWVYGLAEQLAHSTAQKNQGLIPSLFKKLSNATP